MEGKAMSEKQNAIVERLRKYNMHEGADEIERLRAALNGVIGAALSTQGLPSPLADARRLDLSDKSEGRTHE
jgi:hypothetical protein